MNSFSLRPRLLILVHKGRQLLSASRQAPCIEPLFYRANTPVRLPAQKQTVRSQTPVALPRQRGACARVFIELKHWHIAPQSTYLLPDLELQFTPPNSLESIALPLSAGRFETFAQGKPFKQLLEYWATLLDCELVPLGWRVYRQGTSLCIEASPERAGWNIQGTFLFDSLNLKASEALSLPSPFDSREQRAGESSLLQWGPYRLGNTSYVCRLTYDPTWRPEDLQQAFQEALQMQGFPYEIQWPDGYLQLGFPAHLTLQKEKALPLGEREHVFLPLNLAPVQQRQRSIFFRCNHQPCQLQGVLESVPDVLHTLQHQLSPTGIEVTLDDAGHLCFQVKDQQTPFVLSEVSESAHLYLGLSEVKESAPNLEYNERVGEWLAWLDLAHQYAPLLHSETDLRETLEPFLNTVEEKNVKDIHDEGWQKAFQQVLDDLDSWMLASESNLASPLWGAELVNSSQTPNQADLSRKLEPRSDKTSASSSFDHKI
jgi:hypothetical protein